MTTASLCTYFQSCEEFPRKYSTQSRERGFVRELKFRKLVLAAARLNGWFDRRTAAPKGTPAECRLHHCGQVGSRLRRMTGIRPILWKNTRSRLQKSGALEMLKRLSFQAFRACCGAGKILANFRRFWAVAASRVRNDRRHAFATDHFASGFLRNLRNYSAFGGFRLQN